MRLADVQFSSRGGVVIARITGEIDMSNVTELRESITEHTPNASPGVVLDLSAVDYVDSAGIHMLYRLSESLRNRGQVLRVVIPPGSPAADALKLAGIERYVDAVTAVDEGLEALTTCASDEC